MKTKLVPAAEQKPSLVVWVLYDATTDKQYIRMNPFDGSLAVFDSEEAAKTAKRLNSGTDYERCEYYSVPQPAPEVAKVAEALEGLLAIVSESSGVAGYHLNGEIAEWCEFEEVAIAEEALAIYRQQGGDL